MTDLSFKGVHKSYGSTKVIHGVDLHIASGEFVVFVGPSGCGKSTLMRMVAGLEEITDGEICIGERVVNDDLPRDRDIAMVFQDYALYPTKNVYENMAFGLRLRKLAQEEIDQRVRDAAETLQITHLLDRLPRALSGGQRQRVAMGRAIVRKPKVFLFDEPLSNLDALLRNQVRTEIKKLHNRVKGTVIYVTHDQVEAMTLADRIVVLKDGLIMQVGTPDQIYHQPAHRFVAGFTGSPPMNFVPAKIKVEGDAVLLSLAQAQCGEAHTIKLSAKNAEDWRQYADRELEFGIRPENLVLAADKTFSDWPRLDLVVDLVEPMGAENLINFSLAKAPFIGRFGNDVRPPSGQRIAVALNPNQMHLFDAKTGQSLNEYDKDFFAANERPKPLCATFGSSVNKEVKEESMSA